MMFIHQITFKILGKLTESWNIGNDNLYKLCSQRLGNADHSTKYNIHPSNSLQYVKQYQWTVKHRSLFSGQYLCHRLVISKYDIHTSNTLQVTRQNHWLIKYRSCWPIFIMSKVMSHWLIIPKYCVYPSTGLEDILQNHWTVKYGSLN